MGLFDGIKSLKAIKDIRNGKTASLSYGMIVDSLINLQDAQRNLSREQFNKVYALYKDFKNCTTPIKMDQDAYVFHCKEIIGKFDEIAPYELFSGGNELEFSMMMDDYRKEKQAGADKILKAMAPDSCPVDEDYLRTITATFNENYGAVLGKLTRGEAVEIIRILQEKGYNGKTAAVKRLENFLSEIAEGKRNVSENGINSNDTDLTAILMRKVSLISFICGIMSGNNIMIEAESKVLEDKYTKIASSHIYEALDKENDKNRQANAYFESALKRLKCGDNESGVDEMKKAIELGSTEAKCFLAKLYEYGEYVPKNLSLSRNMFIELANQENVEAMVHLGIIYGKEDFPEKDPYEAFYWFKEAADRGYGEAQNMVGIKLINGDGVDRDDFKGFEYIEKAANQGVAQAQFLLAVSYSGGLACIKPDATKARLWLEKAIATDPKFKERAGEIYEAIEKLE